MSGPELAVVDGEGKKKKRPRISFRRDYFMMLVWALEVDLVAIANDESDGKGPPERVYTEEDWSAGDMLEVCIEAAHQLKVEVAGLRSAQRGGLSARMRELLDELNEARLEIERLKRGQS